MKQSSLPVISNTVLCESFYELAVGWDSAVMGECRPGQFVTVRVSSATTPLLRRPFAFSEYDSRGGVAKFIYQKRGPATQLLASKVAGDPVDIIGPLGNWFEPSAEGGPCILAAGGIGVGPMIFLARSLREMGRDVLLAYGCARKSLVPEGESFARAGAVVCTDDGSEGFAGTNVGYLRSLPETRLRGATLYACGPHAMMKACHELAVERGVRCWVSMEQVMACGVGACMGCVVKVKGDKPYARVCAEGPVFDSAVVEW